MGEGSLPYVGSPAGGATDGLSAPHLARRIVGAGPQLAVLRLPALRRPSPRERILRLQVRAGVVWLPWRKLLLAADLDLTDDHEELVPEDSLLNDQRVPSDLTLDAALSYSF